MQQVICRCADQCPVLSSGDRPECVGPFNQSGDHNSAHQRQGIEHSPLSRLTGPAFRGLSVDDDSIPMEIQSSPHCVCGVTMTRMTSSPLHTNDQPDASSQAREKTEGNGLNSSVNQHNVLVSVRPNHAGLATSSAIQANHAVFVNDMSSSPSDTALAISNDHDEGNGQANTKDSPSTQSSPAVTLSSHTHCQGKCTLSDIGMGNEVPKSVGQTMVTNRTMNVQHEKPVLDRHSGQQNAHLHFQTADNRRSAGKKINAQHLKVHTLHTLHKEDVFPLIVHTKTPMVKTGDSNRRQAMALTAADGEKRHSDSPRIARPGRASCCCYPRRAKRKNRVYQAICLAAIYLASVAFTTHYRTQADPPHSSPPTEEKKVEKRHAQHDHPRPADNSTDKVQFCTATHSMPSDFLSPEIAANGGWMLHVFLGVYMFAAVASVCDLYFVPALEHICEDLNLQADVAGATFMAAASSAPEFCTSVIGVFLAKNDIGLGAIVGSSIFNLLAIIGACAIFAGMPVQLSWYPLTRDSLFYLVAVVEMFAFMGDSIVIWPEALIMVLTYLCYILVMAFNPYIERWALDTMEKCRGQMTEKRSVSLNRTSSAKLQMLAARRKSRIQPCESDDDFTLPNSAKLELIKLGISTEEAQHRILQLEEENPRTSRISISRKPPSKLQFTPTTDSKEKPEKKSISGGESTDHSRGPITFQEPSAEEIQHVPKEAHVEVEWVEKSDKIEISDYEDPLEVPEGRLARCYWTFVLPFTLLHAYTIPDSRLQDSWQGKWYLLSFFLSVVYIAFYSYIMVWMISLAGLVWSVPHTVTGLTILAAGTSVPDCLSSVFVARDGYGDMAVSNAIGSNVFDILLCLGVPWLIDSFLLVEHGTPIDSKGMIYAVMSLLGTILYLWCSMYYSDWTLTVKYGVMTLAVYVCIITICIMIELNVFFELNDKGC